jgi:glycosyltransferase involved in cell wall biosynthesis
LVEKIYYSAVVPCHNESGNLDRLVSGLANQLSKEKKPFEIIIVIDNSSDNSREILDKLKSKYKELRYLNRTSNPGVGNAKREGFAAARGEFIITMDGDLSHDPAELPKFLALKDRYDIICGSRYISKGRANMPFTRKLISGGFNLLFRTLIGIKVKDFTSGYRLIRREVFEKVKLESKGFGIYIEIPLKAHIYGYRLVEVPITYHKRAYGKSNLSYLKQGPEYLKVGIKAFWLRLTLPFSKA